MSEKFTGYKNGEKNSIGPSYQKGGYAKYNWCGKCTAIWDKTHWRCGLCHNKLRAKARYVSRREREKNEHNRKRVLSL